MADAGHAAIAVSLFDSAITSRSVRIGSASRSIWVRNWSPSERTSVAHNGSVGVDSFSEVLVLSSLVDLLSRRRLTSTVLALANGIYESKAFDRMPILADVLQDASCDNAEILNHCRGPGPHCRGCFVLDFILGKR